MRWTIIQPFFFAMAWKGISKCGPKGEPIATPSIVYREENKK